MRHYCTYFDKNYLLRGLTLFRSLQEHEKDFVLWVLCCDEGTFQALQTLNVSHLRPIRLSEVEKFEPRLASAKAGRSRVEYLWTLSPIWPLYLFERYLEIENLTYLDADLFFYSSPDPVFAEVGAASVSMFSHRYADADDPMNVNGIYNVGWLNFRRDENALGCLREWREQCLEWCYDRCEDGKYGDQTYLDHWPRDHKGVCVVEHEGAGIAPWNWRRYRFRKSGGKIYCNDESLIFFHFHGLRLLNSWLYDAFYSSFVNGEMPPHVRHWLFDPYLKTMAETAQWARAHGCTVNFGYMPVSQYMKNYGVRTSIKKLARRQIIIHRGLK